MKLAVPSSFSGDSPVRSTVQGLKRGKFYQGGKKRSWDAIKGKREPLVGGYGP